MSEEIFPYPEFDMFNCFDYCKDVWTVHDYDHGEIIIAGSYYSCKSWAFGQHYAEWVITHKTHGDLAKMYKLKPDSSGYYSFEPIHPLFQKIPKAKLSEKPYTVWFFPEGLKEEDIEFKRLPVGEHWETTGKYEKDEDFEYEEEFDENDPEFLLACLPLEKRIELATKVGLINMDTQQTISKHETEEEENVYVFSPEATTLFKEQFDLNSPVVFVNAACEVLYQNPILAMYSKSDKTHRVLCSDKNDCISALRDVLQGVRGYEHVGDLQMTQYSLQKYYFHGNNLNHIPRECFLNVKHDYFETGDEYFSSLISRTLLGKRFRGLVGEMEKTLGDIPKFVSLFNELTVTPSNESLAVQTDEKLFMWRLASEYSNTVTDALLALEKNPSKRIMNEKRVWEGSLLSITREPAVNVSYETRKKELTDLRNQLIVISRSLNIWEAGEQALQEQWNKPSYIEKTHKERSKEFKVEPNPLIETTLYLIKYSGGGTFTNPKDVLLGSNLQAVFSQGSSEKLEDFVMSDYIRKILAIRGLTDYVSVELDQMSYDYMRERKWIDIDPEKIRLVKSSDKCFLNKEKLGFLLHGTL